MSHTENEKYWELVREGEMEHKHQDRLGIKNYYRYHYNVLVEELQKIYSSKSSCKSNVGRHSFQPGVMTPTQIMNAANINENKRRELLSEYREQVRSKGYEI
jgi:hypothetical protein